MIIDAHVHYTPPELAAHLEDFIREEPYWGLLLGGPDSLQGWASAERTIADMDRAKIDKVILMGEYRRKHEGCVARNDQALALMRRYPERIIPFAMIQPKAGRAALNELVRCVDAGMAGVGELGPYGQGYRLDDPDFFAVAEACIRYDIPINIHTNEEIGRYYPGKATTPLRHIYEVAERYPELRLILSHWGGGLLFYELMPAVRRTLRNVWYDTAASPLLYPTQHIFCAALAAVDHRKLLYASDYPLLVYPKRQTEPDFRPFLAQVDGLGLAEEVRADFLGGNAARLLGLLPEGRGEAEGPGKVEPERGLPWVAEGGERRVPGVNADMSVTVVAAAWPATRDVFERYDIPWEDAPAPSWEPIGQAAAARGLGPSDLARILHELNEALESKPRGT